MAQGSVDGPTCTLHLASLPTTCMYQAVPPLKAQGNHGAFLSPRCRPWPSCSSAAAAARTTVMTTWRGRRECYVLGVLVPSAFISAHDK